MSRNSGPCTGTPFTRISPELGSSSPSIMRNRVLLPAPLWPMTPNSSPLRTSRSTRSTASTSPKRFVTRRASMTPLANPVAPVGAARMHARIGVHDAGRPQQRELPGDEAQGLHRRARQQQLHHGMTPGEAVHQVVGLVGHVADAVAVPVPAQVIAPVVALLHAPLLVPRRHVADLLLVADEVVPFHLVVDG